jgi:nitrite reductase (NADH) small subunit
MNAAELKEMWVDVCESGDLAPNLGVRALVEGEQVALYRIQGCLYAIGAIDPFSGAAVLSRGIVGDLKGQLVVASPIYKQHFNLITGVCLEDESVRVKTYPVREIAGRIQVAY